jgi:CRP/FNR family transcriptional regulator, anaerobic regulatory protein
MQTHPDLELTIFKRTLDDLDAARQWMFMIARKTAEERVASLLVLIARKLTGDTADDAAPVADLEFALPLSRTEIAECLGLRLETVSRQFAALKAEGVIATGRRRSIKVCDLASLAARAQGHAHLPA